jgi:uncharacterized protein YndB with AHSA1/START domain
MSKSLHVSRQRLVHAPSERVWSVVGDFGHEDRWARNIRQSSRDTPDVRVGTVRTLALARPLMGRNRVEEVVIAVEPGQMLAYRLRGSAGPFASAESHWRLREEGRGTIVEVEGRFTPRSALLGFLVGGPAKVAVRRTLDVALRELAAQVEGDENGAAPPPISPGS